MRALPHQGPREAAVFAPLAESSGGGLETYFRLPAGLSLPDLNVLASCVQQLENITEAPCQEGVPKTCSSFRWQWQKTLNAPWRQPPAKFYFLSGVKVQALLHYPSWSDCTITTSHVPSTEVEGCSVWYSGTNSCTKWPNSLYVKGGSSIYHGGPQQGDFIALGVPANARDVSEARDAARHHMMHRTALSLQQRLSWLKMSAQIVWYYIFACCIYLQLQLYCG